MLLRARSVLQTICVFAAGLSIAQAFAYAQDAHPTFEVAAVKASDPASPIAIRRLPGGRFVTSNTSLQLLITWAYDIGDERLAGAPGWLSSARFDVNAKTANENTPGEQVHLMVQALLAERFGLKVHREKRQLPLYTLERDERGPKVTALPEGTPVSQNPFRMTVAGRLTGMSVTAAMLAKVLSGELGHYVEDRTQYPSVFDFTLAWRPDNASGADAVPDDPRPSLFTAIREQLGFRLVAGKGAVDVIAIDRIERNPIADN